VRMSNASEDRLEKIRQAKSMFAIVKGSGFNLTFANGWTVSIVWSSGTYTSNQHTGDYLNPKPTSNTAEVAAWHTDHAVYPDNWYNFGVHDDDHDVVKGWMSTNDVAEFIHMVANLLPPPRERHKPITVRQALRYAMAQDAWESYKEDVNHEDN